MRHYSFEKDRALSKRERQCIHLAAEGKTVLEIASALHIAPGTVKFYLKNIRNKLDCVNMANIVYKVMKQNLFPL